MEKEIDLSNIEKGMVFKNYRKMCEALGESACGGKQKITQFNRWRRYFQFTKEENSQQLTITEIYDVPFPNDDLRRKKEGLYMKYIELLLLDYLSQQTECQAEFSKHDLYRILGLVGDNYFVPYRTVEDIQDEMYQKYDYSLSTFEVQHFLQRAEQKMNTTLTSALKSMKNRGLIDYSKMTYIVNTDNENNAKVERATAIQEEMILEAENKILSDMALFSIFQVFEQFRTKEYYSRLYTYFKSRYKWNSVHNKLFITYTKDNDNQAPLKAEEIRKLSNDEKKKELNGKMVESLNKQAEDEHEKTIKEYKPFIGKRNYEGRVKIILEDGYVQKQKDLADYLVKIREPLEENKGGSKK